MSQLVSSNLESQRLDKEGLLLSFLVAEKANTREGDITRPPIRKAKDTAKHKRYFLDNKLICVPNNSSPFNFNIMAYNIWMMPEFLTSCAPRSWNLSPKKRTRALAIADNIAQQNAYSNSTNSSLDVIVFCEAFCQKAADLLSNELKGLGYFYSTAPAHLWRRFLSSGVRVYSKYPIIAKKTMFFKNCAGDETLASKGCTYCCVNKNGSRVHVFATHVQAWNTSKAKKVRVKQFKQLRHFIDRQRIPDSEPVIITGDLNVNQFDTEEYELMLRELNCTNFASPNQAPTFDYTVNDWCKLGGVSTGDQGDAAASSPFSTEASMDRSELLDYVLVCNKHGQPRIDTGSSSSTSNRTVAHARIETLHLRDKHGFEHRGHKVRDLSDHFPIVGEFRF